VQRVTRMTDQQPIPQFAATATPPRSGDDGAAVPSSPPSSPPTTSSGDPLYRQAFDQSLHLLCVLGPDGHVLAVNGTMLTFFGAIRSRVVGRPLAALVFWQADDRARATISDLVRSAAAGNFAEAEVDVVDAGGTPRALGLSVKPIRSRDGTISTLLCEARDVTERKRQQALLIQAQKLQAVGQLATGIAHDFRNLLTVVSGHLELIRKGSRDDIVAGRVDRAMEAVSHGEALIARMMSVARPRPLESRPLALGQVLEETRGLLESSLGAGYTLRTVLDTSLWIGLADRGQLESALLNLAVNARDAMPGGGEIVLGARNVRAPAGSALCRRLSLSPGDYVALSVADSGCGIEPRLLESVVEPFVTTKADGRGSGLGLASANQYIMASGGALDIQSTPGQGTTVCLYVPRFSRADGHA